MARCDFATWSPIGYNGGSYTGGPFKIVHHTTETPNINVALREFKIRPFASHFLVDGVTILQLVDTGVACRALQNLNGGVQTNRDSAIQIELVAYAGQPKPKAGLDNVRKLCRWIEETHGVPRVWPSGYPLPPGPLGGDPAISVPSKNYKGIPHNRNAVNWDTKGGHYCHSQVPENIHWDSAYTKEEVDFLMSDAMAHEDGTVYTVRPGDTLTKVSKMFGVPVADLATINSLRNPDDIIVGQILKVRNS